MYKELRPWESREEHRWKVVSWKWSPQGHPPSERPLWPVKFSSVQLLSHVQLFATLWTTARQASLSITNSQSFLKFMPIELVMPSSHLILCHPLLLLPSISPNIRVFSNKSVLCSRWSKYWSFSFCISPSREYSVLTSFRIDWFDLLSVSSLLQHHSSKTSILWRSAFFIVQLSHPYMTTGKTIALTVCVCVLVAQSCPTVCNPVDCSPPGSSFHGILQVRVLEWVASSFSNSFD